MNFIVVVTVLVSFSVLVMMMVVVPFFMFVVAVGLLNKDVLLNSRVLAGLRPSKGRGA